MVATAPRMTCVAIPAVASAIEILCTSSVSRRIGLGYGFGANPPKNPVPANKIVVPIESPRCAAW